MERSEKAVSTFESGLNCSQAVLSSFSEVLKLDNGLAIRISCGFGAGMGRLQETCGAVSGGIMVIGMAFASANEDRLAVKEKTYAKIIEFTKRFKEIHSSIKCRDLLKCDITTEEGRRYMEEHDLSNTVCSKCVKDAVVILEDIINT
jgi:C_GCAxxG_C_C family probable redox protein